MIIGKLNINQENANSPVRVLGEIPNATNKKLCLGTDILKTAPGLLSSIEGLWGSEVSLSIVVTMCLSLNLLFYTFQLK